MALNIPMPDLPGNSLLKGLDTGGTLFSRLMQPRLAREQQALEREKQKQLDQHFMQQLLAKKEAAERAQSFQSRFDPQKMAIMQQQLLGLKQRNDPNYELNKFMNAANAFGGGSGGFDAGQLKQNPLLRGFFKHQFGFDPLAPTPQTPEEKQAAELELFRQKEAIKAAKNSGETATNKVLTQNQQAIQAIDTVLPMVDEFITKPDLVYGTTDFSPSKKAAYNAKTGGMIDMLVAAQSLPQVQASIDLVEQQIRRGTGESVEAYIKRLKDFRKDLVSRRGKSQGVVASKKVNSAPLEDFSNMSDEELRRIAGGG